MFDWLHRFFCNRADVEYNEKLDLAFQKIVALEREQKITRLNMHNLQSALLAISTTQDGTSQDIRRLQEAIQEMLEGIQYSVHQAEMHGDDFN